MPGTYAVCATSDFTEYAACKENIVVEQQPTIAISTTQHMSI